MENTHLIQLLKSLSPVELRVFDRFLQSPYFNRRTDICRLFQVIRLQLETRQPLSDRTALFQLAFPDKRHTAGEMRLMMTYLTKLFEQFIQAEQLARMPVLADWLQVKALYRLDLEKEGDKAVKKAFEHLEKAPLRSAAYHEQQYHLMYEQMRRNRELPEENARNLQQLSKLLDTTLAALWLRQACLVLSEKAVYNMNPDTRFLPEVFRWVETENRVDIPAVGAYYYACKMLMTGEELWFLHLKKTVSRHSAGFPPEELHDLHLLAINYCVRQLNTGNEHYFQEVHDLYKAGLETKTLLNKGVLSPLTYYNIVISGLKINALDWVAWFIPHYKHKLERRYRDSAFSFNMARLHYARREYGEALLLLQKANYRDLLTNLAAKTMALKIYYEQGEFEVLGSHLDAMFHYVRRKRVIGYHRENYLNIIRITKRLLALPPSKGPALDRLRHTIETTDPLTERGWFLEVMEK